MTNEQAQRTTTIVGFVILAIGAIAAYFHMAERNRGRAIGFPDARDVG